MYVSTKRTVLHPPVGLRCDVYVDAFGRVAGFGERYSREVKCELVVAQATMADICNKH